MPHELRTRRLAIALFVAGEARDQIIERCGIQKSTLDRWRKAAHVPARTSPPLRDEEAIARAWQEYEVQEKTSAPKIPFVVSAEILAQANARLGEVDRGREEDACCNARLRTQVGPVKLICPSGCTCLICQLAVPTDIYASSPFCADEKHLPTTRNVRPGAQ